MRRLLYIAHRLPYPPDKGERVRAFHQIKALSSRFQVTLAALTHGEADRQEAAELSQWCHQLILAPAGGRLGLVRAALSVLRGKSASEGFFHSRHLAGLIRRAAAREEFDVVLAYCTAVLPYALDVPAAGHVIDLVDVDSAKWAGYADSSGRLKRRLYRHEAAAVGKLERQALRRCDAVLVVSEAEADLLPGRCDKIVPVANGVDCDFFSPGQVEPIDLGPAALVFTGTMDYRPNVEGVCWFVREVYPALRREIPDLTFAVVGRDPTRAVRRLTRVPGVTVTGSVPDVRPYVEGARAAVCPLRIARGIQNKVLEAMAMAKPVVASGPALEGIDARVGRDLLQADSAEQWHRHISDLLSAPSAGEKLAAAARQHVETNYDWPTRMGPLVSLCERLAAGADSSGPDVPPADRANGTGCDLGPPGPKERIAS